MFFFNKVLNITERLQWCSKILKCIIKVGVESYRVSFSEEEMNSKKNRKKIYLVSAATQVWPKGPTLPPISSTEQQPAVVPEEPVPVPTQPDQNKPQSYMRKLILSANDEAQFMKAPRIVFKGHRLSVQCIAVLPTPNRQDHLYSVRETIS